MDNSWLKLYRKTLYSDMYKNLTSVQRDVMMVCLMKAGYKNNKWEYKGKIFETQQGQFITSLESLKKLTAKGTTVKKIRTALVKLKKWHFLAYEGAKEGTLVTVLNWESYQGNGEKGQTKGQDEGKIRASNKNVKNVKKKEKIYRKEKVFMTEPEYQKLCDKYGQATTDQYIEDLNLYLMQTGRRYKSHYATVQAWYRKDEREGKIRKPKNNSQNGYDQFMEKVMNDRR